MALSGSLPTVNIGNKYMQYMVDWSATQNTSANTSTLTIKHYLKVVSGKGSVSAKTGTDSGGGSSVNWSSPAISLAGTKTINLGTSTMIVSHDSSGAKSFTLTSKWFPKAHLNGATRNEVSTSGTVSLNTIPRNPNKPSVSLYSKTRNSITLEWSTNMTTSHVSYRLNKTGSWVTTASSGTNGRITISELANGKSYDIEVDVKASASSLWTGGKYGTITESTNNVSTVSNLTLKPAFGYDNRLILAFSSSQTGGTTTVQYQPPGSSTWHNTTGGHVSGLAGGREYTVNVRAKNNSGEINNYSVKGTTYTRPGGSFSITKNSKTQFTVNMLNITNTTNRYTSIDGAAWVATSNNSVAFSGRKPGTSASLRVRLYSSTTGLENILSAQTVTLDALAKLSSTSLSNVLRNKATLNFTFSDNIKEYSYSLTSSMGSGNKTVTGKTASITVPESSNFTSGTSYTITVKALDASANMWGPEVKYTFKSKDFVPPVITAGVAKLTNLNFTESKSDSCTFVKVNNAAYTVSGSTYNITKVNGAALKASTGYDLEFVYKDTYGPEKTVIASSTTKGIDINTSSVANSTIKSYTDSMLFPSITVSTDGAKYKKKIVYKFGAVTKSLDIPINTTLNTYKLTAADVIGIITAAASKSYAVSYQIFYYEDGLESGTVTPLTLGFNLDNLLLKAPKAVPSYSNTKTGKTMTAIYSYSLNTVTINYEKPAELFGKPLSAMSVEFNGVTQAADITNAGSLVFGPFTNPISTNGAEIKLTDSRGLIATSIVNIATETYSPPTIMVTSVAREGGFGTALQINNINMAFTKAKIGGLDNTITSLVATYVTGEFPNETTVEINDTTNLMEHLRIEPKTGGVIDKEKSVLGNGYDIFKSTEAYKLKLKIQDRFAADTGVEGVIDNIIISTGKPLAFFDELNRQVGINTTTPRGEFEVDGDIYGSNVFSLNGLFFDVEDVE